MLVDKLTLKAYLKLSATDTTQDDFLDTLLSWSDSQIVNICGQQIALTQPSPHIINGNGGVYYTLPNTPIRSIVSLKSRSNSNTTNWDVTYTPFGSTAGDYELQGDTIYFPGGFAAGYGGNYQVVYKYGYQDIPQSVQSVALEMAALAYKESYAGGNQDARLGVSSTSVNAGGISTTKSYRDMMPLWCSQLDSYRYLGRF